MPIRVGDVPATGGAASVCSGVVVGKNTLVVGGGAGVGARIAAAAPSLDAAGTTSFVRANL